MSGSYCTRCENWVEDDEDEGIPPCGDTLCPQGYIREDEDPTPLDFSVDHRDDWLAGEGEEGNDHELQRED